MRRTRRTASTVIGGLAVAFFCLAGVINSVMDLNNERALRTSGQVTEAEATQTILSSSLFTGKTPRVKYQFTLDGVEYRYDDTLLRNYASQVSHQAVREADEWANVENTDWQTARDSAVVPVLYLPGNPWVNRPLHYPKGLLLNPLNTAVLSIGLYAAFFLLALMAAIFGVQEKEDPSRKQMRSLSDVVNKNPGKQG